MSFFTKSKFKAKTTVELDKVKFCINYYNVKNSDKMKCSFLEGLIGGSYCLVTINTNMLYQNKNKDAENALGHLITELDKLNISYRKKLISSTNDTKILGFTVNKDTKKASKNYVLGFTVNSGNLEALQAFIDPFTLHYYVSANPLEEHELLNSFELNYLNEEELTLGFKYDVLDSTFIKQLVITSAPEGSDFITEIIDKINQEV